MNTLKTVWKELGRRTKNFTTGLMIRPKPRKSMILYEFTKICNMSVKHCGEGSSNGIYTHIKEDIKHRTKEKFQYFGIFK
jgi:hypothetical protein